MRVFVALVLLCLVGAVLAQPGSSTDWWTHGGNENNTRYTTDSDINSGSATDMSQVWTWEADSWITATPAIQGSHIFFPSRDGNFLALNKANGSPFWSVFIPDLTGISEDYSRDTPVFGEDSIVFGTQQSCFLICLNPFDGEVIWIRDLSTSPGSVITMSPTISLDNVYVGVSSLEDRYSNNPNYPCCSSVGAMYRISLFSGRTQWETPMISPTLPVGPGKYSGVPIWGSTPVIDHERGLLYIGTGSTYGIPEDAFACGEDNPRDSNCVSPGVLYNGIVALNINNGQVAWYRRLTAFDSWIRACFFGGPNCLEFPGGPFADFGMAPMLVFDNSRGHEVLLVSQKSGITFSLNPDDGGVYWATKVGPGGPLGGANWGAASDGTYYYVGNLNSLQLDFVLASPSSTTVNGGAWSKLRISTGEIVLQLADPENFADDDDDNGGSAAAGPPTVANDIMIVGSTAGKVYFIDTSDFSIVNTFTPGVSVYGGAAVSGSCVYIGSGYDSSCADDWTFGDVLYAWCVDD
jgi:polyvinyl alcohol dehydrogenase (cytochrome)